MQEYRRQIAYIYAYEHGEPVRNAGFVKAEVRGDRCRLGIHLKAHCQQNQDAGKIYIYFAYQDRRIGIYLGELKSRNGALEWQGTMDPENIQGKGICFAETKGIWVRRFGRQDYVADWEEDKVNTDHFIMYPKGGKKCIQCPRLENCRRSAEDVSDERRKVHERSHPSGS